MSAYVSAGRLFHSRDCYSSYREDRRAGLMYGSAAVPTADIRPGMLAGGTLDNGALTIVGWDDAARVCGFCPYCGPNADYPTA